MATERRPEYGSLIGQWSESEHRRVMVSPGCAYLIASPTGADRQGFAIVRDIEDPDGNVFLKRVAVSAPGTGFGSMFMRGLVDWIFDNTRAHRIWLDAIDYSLRAQHVYGKLGFVKEGLLRECYIRPDGGRVSLVIMSLLRYEWRSD